MGINMGIEVECYQDLEPKLPDPKMVEKEFFAFLHERFPDCVGGGWVSRKEKAPLQGDTTPRVEWDFDVRPFLHGEKLEAAGFTNEDVFGAIFEFILARFSYDEGFDFRLYWSQ